MSTSRPQGSRSSRLTAFVARCWPVGGTRSATATRVPLQAVRIECVTIANVWRRVAHVPCFPPPPFHITSCNIHAHTIKVHTKYMLAAASLPRPPSLTCACLPAAGFPVLVIHGRNDKLASSANAEALAHRLGAPCVIL